MSKIKVMLVDDHQLLREGISSMLATHPDIEVIGDAGNGRIALQRAAELQPDIVIMDIGMPELNGVEATRQLTARKTGVKVIGLSTHLDKRYVIEMLSAGASGFILKENAAEELLRAIRSVARGQKYLSPEVASTLIETHIGKTTTGFDDDDLNSNLGSREREVLQLLAEGKSSPQIAEILHISVSTVEAHRRNIMRKIGLHSVAELTKYAVRHGLTML